MCFSSPYTASLERQMYGTGAHQWLQKIQAIEASMEVRSQGGWKVMVITLAALRAPVNLKEPKAERSLINC